MQKSEIEAELRKELDALIQAFGMGKEVSISYEPKDRIEDFYGEDRYCGGEYREDTKTIVVHRKTLEGAKETLAHEFFEYLLEPLYGDQVDSFNIIVPDILKAYGKAFSKIQYRKKEQIIALLTRDWNRRRKK